MKKELHPRRLFATTKEVVKNTKRYRNSRWLKKYLQLFLAELEHEINVFPEEDYAAYRYNIRRIERLIASCFDKK